MENSNGANTDKDKIIISLQKEDEIRPSHFDLDIEKIEEIFKGYDNRTFDQDIMKIKEYGKPEGIAIKLKTNFQTGISSDPEEMNNRVVDFCDNKRLGDELPHFCEFVWEALEDTMIRILIVAAIVQIVVGCIPALTNDPSKDWIDGLSIVFAVVVVVVVGSVTNYNKEEKFKQLNDKKNDMVKIHTRRDGRVIDLSEEDLLVGDVIKIDCGNIMPVDGILIEGKGIKIDESSMTGETNLCKKDCFDTCMIKRFEKMDKSKDGLPNGKHLIPSPIIYSGTNVKEGTGWVLVLAIGKYSKKGKIESEILANQEGEESKTPLETKLEDIADDIGKFGIAAAVLTLIALSINLGISESQASSSRSGNNSKDSTSNPIALKIIRMFILCIAIIVVAIPEGLPLAVTLTLSFSISKMMDDNNLVRKMQACETMGGANYICSDKTGTLTNNVMTVNVIFDNKNNIDTSKLIDFQNPKSLFQDDHYKLLKLSMALNINIEFNDKNEICAVSKTENAFVLFLENMKENLKELRLKYFPDGMANVKFFPFTSERKKMSTIVTNPEFPKKHRIFLKGGSEYVLNCCQFCFNPDTKEINTITDEQKNIFQDTIKRYAKLTLRTICLAYKDISDNECENWQENDDNGQNILEENGYILIGIVGIKDTLRDGVSEAVEKLRVAGITVIMVTGDNIDTAVAISKDCKILNGHEDENKASMLGSSFYEAIGGVYCENCSKDVSKCLCPRTEGEAKKRKLDSEKLRKDKIRNIKKFEEIILDLRVLARSRPEDKYTLVLGLRELGNVVAVTGDGTNDAPALSKSDVGFSMGIQGTDIAKNASDIIILDDDFSSIVKAVLWGRNIFDNIRKFIKFQLTVNIAAVLLVFVCVCVGNETPITTIQMLWINMIMDSLGSLALATEPPHEDLLFRKPYSRDEYIISTMMWKHILPSALIQFSLMIILYLYAPAFIIEDNKDRILQAQYLKNCFGRIPGPNGANYIISGLTFDWDTKITRFNNVTLSSCPLFYNSFTLYDCQYVYGTNFGNTAHLTIVFNSFVFYTLFNQINARVLSDDLNVFYRIRQNILFVVIVVVEAGAQAIIIQFGGIAFQCSNGGLTGRQWGICLGFGLLCFPITFIMKFIPMEKCLDAMILRWNERNWCRSKVEVADLPEESKRLAEEDSPMTAGVGHNIANNNIINNNTLLMINKIPIKPLLCIFIFNFSN